MEFETSMLAILCPKNTENFKGSTFAFDGQKWQYVCGDMPAVGNSPITQPYQPIDQKDAFIQKLVSSIKAINAIGTEVTSGDMIKIADKITPGDALGLIQAAKMAGYIIESNGIFKVA